MNFGRTPKKALKSNDRHGLRSVGRHRPRQASVVAADPPRAEIQPFDAHLSDAQPASCPKKI
jgi:hypothetical protein